MRKAKGLLIVFLLVISQFLVFQFVPNVKANPDSNTWQVGASSDDCNVYESGTSHPPWDSMYALTFSNIRIGYYGALTTYNGVGVRFTGINIPQGSIINSAKLQIYAADTTSGTINARIAAQNSDSTTTFSNIGDYNGRSRTSYVTWAISAWTASTWYDSPDITSCVQGVVNRDGWVSGNSMAFFVEDDGTGTSTERCVGATWDFGTGEYAPKLIISYTTPLGLTTKTFSVVSNEYDQTVENTGTPYLAIHDAVNGNSLYLNALLIEQSTQVGNTIDRSLMRFDTSIVEGYVSSAKLRLGGKTDQSDTDFYIRIQKWTDADDGVGYDDYSKFDGINYDDGNFYTTSWTLEVYNDIIISNFDIINQVGFTDICVRSSRDISSTAPSGWEMIQPYDSGEVTNLKPILEVTYLPAEDYIDVQSNVDSVADKGTHSNFATQKWTDSTFDTMAEADQAPITGNSENFVDNSDSDVDGHTGHGTHSSFPAMQAGPDSTFDTLTEADAGGTPLTITFVNVGAETTGAGAVTPPLPASMASGDICILVATTAIGYTISITADGSITPWTALTGSPIGVIGGEKLYVWWGRWTSGTTGPTVTPSGDHIESGIGAWRNCIGSDSPIDVSQTGTETTSDTSFSFATTISTTVNGAMCIAICTTGNDAPQNTQFTVMTDASLTSLAERMDYCTNTGGGGGFALDEGYKATAGAVGTWAATLSTAETKAYISFALKPALAVNYELDLEFQWTTADFAQTSEYLCIYTGTVNAEALKVDVRNGGSWTNIIASLSASQWNNVSIGTYLTSATITFRFLGGTESSDTTQSTWQIDVAIIHVWTQSINYELELEEQFTNANYSRTNEELCIKMGTMNGETLSVQWRNTTSNTWVTIIASLTASVWNNISVTSYLTSATFTIRFIDGTKTGDTSQSSWLKDCALLHTWDVSGQNYPRSVSQLMNVAQTTSKIMSFTKLASQSFQLSHLISRLFSISKSVSQALSILQQASRAVTFPKLISQQTNLLGTAQGVFQSSRSLSQPLQILASTSKILSFTKSFNQPFSMLAQTVRTQSLIKSFSQQLSLTTQTSGMKLVIRSIQQSTSVFTQVTRAVSFVKSSNQALNLYVQFSKIISFTLTFNQPISLISSITRIVNAVRQTQISLNIATSVSKILSLSRTFNQPLLAYTQASRIISTLRSISQQLSLISQVSKSLSFVRSFSQPMNLITQTARAISFVKTFNQQISLTTQISKMLSFSRLFSQPLNLDMQITKILSFTRLPQQSFSLYMQSARVLSFVKGVNQIFSLNVEVSRMLSTIHSINQAFSITSAVSKAVSSLRSITQQLDVATSTLRILSSVRATSQSLNILLQVEGIKIILKAVSQSTMIFTSVSKQSSLIRSLQQSLSIFTQAQRTIAILKNANQLFSVVSSVSRIGNFLRTVNQQVNIVGTFNYLKVALRDVSQAFQILTNIAKQSSFARSLQQATLLSLHVQKTMQILKSFNQFFSITTTISRIQGILKTANQSFSITIQTTRIFNALRAISQPLNILQTVDSFKLGQNFRSVSQIIQVSTSITRIQSLTKTFNALTSLTTQISKAFNTARTAQSILSLSTTIQRIFQATRTPSQALQIFASITKHLSMHYTFSQLLKLNLASVTQYFPLTTLPPTGLSRTMPNLGSITWLRLATVTPSLPETWNGATVEAIVRIDNISPYPQNYTLHYYITPYRSLEILSYQNTTVSFTRMGTQTVNLTLQLPKNIFPNDGIYVWHIYGQYKYSGALFKIDEMAATFQTNMQVAAQQVIIMLGIIIFLSFIAIVIYVQRKTKTPEV